MSADLHIHVITDDISEDDFRAFFGNTLGSHYGPRTPLDLIALRRQDEDAYREASRKFDASPQVWIGEVSWLKAAIMEGGDEEYIPGPVQAISDLIPDYPHPVLTEDLRNKILSALKAENKTGYATAGRGGGGWGDSPPSSYEDVSKFLGEHLGKQIFTVSW